MLFFFFIFVAMFCFGFVSYGFFYVFLRSFSKCYILLCVLLGGSMAPFRKVLGFNPQVHGFKRTSGTFLGMKLTTLRVVYLQG